MEKLTKRQSERLAFAEIEILKRKIIHLDQSTCDADKIKSKRAEMENLYSSICDTTIKEILNYAPILSKIERTRIEYEIKSILKSFDYRLGMSFFDYAKKSIFRNAAPVKFIENCKQAMCVQLFTRSLNCLLDIGLSKESVRQIDCRDIDYVFITHEHLDHYSGLLIFPQDTKTVFLSNEATQQAIFEQKPALKNLKWRTFKTGETFKIQNIEVSTIPLRHDCMENVAYKLDDGLLQTVYLVDFGKWTETEIEFCNEADRVIIEAYYDKDSPEKKFPLNLRMKSSHGHLSKQSAAEFVKKLKPKTDREVYFCHY